MPEPDTILLTPEETETEGLLLALLELPAAPASLDARVLAAARSAIANSESESESEPKSESEPARTAWRRGRVLLFPLLVRVAAAAAVLALASLAGRAVTPHAQLVLSDDLPPEVLALGAVVVEAEGAFGAYAQPKLVGSRVSSGEPLAVRPGGFLHLRLPEGTELVFDGGSRSTLHFDRNERRLELPQGRLYAKVIKVGTTFERRPIVIETPAGDARVLGTELMVRSVGARAQVTVRRGTVRVENDLGRSLVGASESGLLTPDAAPATRLLSSVDRQFRWIGKIQKGQRHPVERAFGGVVGEDDPAIGTLSAYLPDGSLAVLALASQEVECRVQDGVNHTTVKLAFRNDSSQDLEGTFRFALPKASSVTRYAVDVKGRLAEGRIVEREEARAIYREQKERLEEPALLEWAQGNAFTAKVFPIEAGGLKHIEIGYTEVLDEKDGVSRLVVPLVSEASRAHPPEHLSLTVQLFGPEAQAALRCPSHYVRAAREGGGVTISLDAEGLRPRNDFVLQVARSDAHIVDARVEEGDPGEPATALVRIRPDLSWLGEHMARGPLVVLCDVSASQAGTAKEVQLEVLEALLEDASSSARVFVVHAETEELVAGERARLDGLIGALWRSETGGAQDLALAFQRLARVLPPDAGATLVYLGDGVSTSGRKSDAQVARAFARNLPPEAVRRFVAVGIGGDVNRALLSRLARERNGVFVGVRPGDDLGRRLDETLAAISEPVLTQIAVRLEVPGIHEVSPRQPQNLRPGEVLDISARLRGDARHGTVVITGVAAGRPFEARAPLTLTASRGNRLDALWARRRIADLLEAGPRAEDEITDLALYHGLVSPYTSLLVLSDEEYQRSQARRRKSQQSALQDLLDRSANALRSLRYEQAESLALRALRKERGIEAARDMLQRVLAGREAAAKLAGMELIDPGATASGPQPTGTPAPTVTEWLTNTPLSLGFAADEGLVLEFYDVNDLIRRVPDFPSPELGLNPGGQRDSDPKVLLDRWGNPFHYREWARAQISGGGATGGVLTFEDEDADVTLALDGDTLIELIESGRSDGDGSVELSNGVLIVRGGAEGQARVRKLLATLRSTKGIRVTVESRFVEVSDNFLEHVGSGSPNDSEQEGRAETYFATGKALFQQLRYREAAANLQRAAALDPGNAAAVALRDRCLSVLGNRKTTYSDSTQELVNKRLASIDQARSKIARLFSEGETLMQRQRYDAAQQTFERVLEAIRWFPYEIDRDGLRAQAQGRIAAARQLAQEQELRRLKMLQAAGRQAAEHEKSGTDRFREAALRVLLADRAEDGEEQGLKEKIEELRKLSSGGTGRFVTSSEEIAKNEEKAIGALRTIGSAQSLFREADKEADGTLEYRTLTELGGGNTKALVDSLLGGGKKTGYAFHTTGDRSFPESDRAKAGSYDIWSSGKDATNGSWRHFSPSERESAVDMSVLNDESPPQFGLLLQDRRVEVPGASMDQNHADDVRARLVAEGRLKRALALIKRDETAKSYSTLDEDWVYASGRYWLPLEGAEVNQTGVIPVLNPVLGVKELAILKPVPFLTPAGLAIQLGRLDSAHPTQRPAIFQTTLRLAAQTVQRDPGLALECLERLARYAPTNVDVHERIGAAHLLLGDPSAALRAFSEMVEVAPSDADVRWRYAGALLKLSLRRRALVEAREAVRLRPDVARYHLGLAALARALGRAQEAERALLGVLRTNFHPDQGDVGALARAQLSSLWRSVLSRASGRDRARGFESLVRSLQALEGGALIRRPVRITLQPSQGSVSLSITAAGEEPVTPASPFSAAGGRLSKTGAEYTHTTPGAGAWQIAVTASDEAARGTLTILIGEGTPTAKRIQLPYQVPAGQTETVFTGSLASL